MRELHGELTATGGHGTQGADVAEHFCQRNIGLDAYTGNTGFLTRNHAATTVQVTNHVTDVIFRREHVYFHDGLKQLRAGFRHGLAESALGSGRENYFPRELSGGQQQRVGIARSLAVEPDIWFLDEPFSALDPLIRKEMQDEFLRLQGVLKKTILFVTHDFDEALRLADRIAIMKDGIIEQLDTPANIVLNPATEYVRKFTEEVPREKVLKIESVMDPVNKSEQLSDLKISKDVLIETVAEKILVQEKPVAVIDSNNKVVGVVHSSKVIHVLFGGKAGKKNKD